MLTFEAWVQEYLSVGYFAGITFGDWVRMLARHRFAVHPRYWSRVAFITSLSACTSVLRRAENLAYARRINRLEVLPPVFILGHHRSGTTHLLNLLAQDQRFAYPTFYEVNFPHTFLLSVSWGSWLYDKLLPTSRIQDNVLIGPGSPEEDEWAMCILSQMAPQIGWAFPRQLDDYAHYWTLNELSPEERQRWQRALAWFCRKLQLNKGRPLLLKSPAHTCRIRWLLELFPAARFIEIHRNPYDVYRSTRHFWRKVRHFCQLQEPTDCDLDDERVLRNYQRMYAHYFADRGLIPAGQLYELSYEGSLERDPLGVLESAYSRLGLPDFETARAPVQQYLKTTAKYEKNRHVPIPADLVERINREWRQAFDEWGYAAQAPEKAEIAT